MVAAEDTTYTPRPKTRLAAVEHLREAVASLPYAERAREALAAARYDGAMWRRWAFFGASHAPEWFRRYSPPVFGTAFFAALWKHSRIVADNQAQLLGIPKGSVAAWAAAQRVYSEFSMCLIDALEMSGKPDRMFERMYDGSRHFAEARARGRGVILVTGHTGSWEVGGRLLGLLRDVRTTMVMALEGNETARRYVDGLRKRSGVDVIYASGNDPTTAITLLQRLRANEVVAIQIDRPPASGNTVETTFCGRPWRVPEGPFRLAQASGAPIIPVFLHRSGYRRYTFTISPPFHVPRTRDPAPLAEVAQRVTTAFETFVRAHPDQWFHFTPLP